jgi:sirohydrochlorin ferrochelatase
VQPHLLFSGHVEEQVSAAVRDGRKARPEIEWVQVNRLGPDPLVAEAVVERAAQAADEAWACRDRGTVSPETA